MVKINGEPIAAAGKSVAAYLAEAGYDSRAVAVEYNEVILPKADYEKTILADGDVVEIVAEGNYAIGSQAPCQALHPGSLGNSLRKDFQEPCILVIGILIV